MWFQLGIEFARKGHRVVHISRSLPELPDQEMIAGVHHCRLKGYDSPSNGLWLKLLDLRYSYKVSRILPAADILITNTFWMPMLSQGNQRRVGQTYVDVQRMPKGQMRLYGRVARLRCNSNAVRNQIEKEAPDLVPLTRVIPNPLPFTPPLYSLLDKDQNIILYCGRLHPEKGIDLLLKAFSIASRRGLEGWRLRLVGPWDVAAGGGGMAWIKRLKTHHLHASSLIDWVGPLYNNEQLQAEYEKASIFVYPSLSERGETFGLAPLEAMAFGACPLVSALDCFRDFIESDVNGIVLDHRQAEPAQELASSLLDLARDSQKRERIAHEALKVRQSHHPSRVAQLFLDDFASLL
jgi:glycosyltransferase involved in cell wall biosynthesis